MDAVQVWRKDRQDHLDEIKALMSRSDEEARGLTSEERDEIIKRQKSVSDLEVKISDEVDKQNLRNMIESSDRLEQNGVEVNPVREPATTRGKTLGDMVAGTEQMKSVIARFKSGDRAQFSGQPITVPYSMLRAKAAGDPVLESDNTSLFGTGGSIGALATALGLETPGFTQYRLTIEDLFASVPVTQGNGVFYPVVDVRTLADGSAISDTQTKPGAEYKFDMVNKVLETRAAWIKIHESFLEDAPGLAAYINSDLPFMVRQNVEAYIAGVLYSDATNTGSPDDGAPIGGDNGYDAILDSITEIQEAGGNPNALIVTPRDYAFLRATKFDGGSEEYVGGGPSAGNINPWTLRPVVTPSASNGLPLVLDTTAGKVYRRGGVSVQSTNSNEDDFINNLVTIRAETRLVFGLTYPEWVRVAEIGSAS